MAAGTNPPRVMQTMASNGPLSARRQANARASRWNWSQETGKDLREVGWTMLDPNAKRWPQLASLFCRVRPPARLAAGVARFLPIGWPLGCPKALTGRHSAQKGLPEEASAAQDCAGSDREGSTQAAFRPPSRHGRARWRRGRAGRYRRWWDAPTAPHRGWLARW